MNKILIITTCLIMVISASAQSKKERKENKISELLMDASGNVLKKTTFTYNPKKLKSGKQIISNTNIPESGKKWEYEYY